jgi:hypothetical protein
MYHVYVLGEPEGYMCDKPLEFQVETGEGSWARYHVGSRVREINKP